MHTLALVGHLTLWWVQDRGGEHGKVSKRWYDKLQQLGFGQPLDDLDEYEKVVPTARRRGINPCRVDYLFVRSLDAMVPGYVRHDRFWQEIAWPAVAAGLNGVLVRQPYISDHTPLSLHLRLGCSPLATSLVGACHACLVFR